MTSIRHFLIAGILAFSLFQTGCSTSPKKPGVVVSYEEFQKVLRPRSITLLEGQNAFLTVIAMPGDKYPKVYRYDYNTKEFALEYDHGQSIGSIRRTRHGETIYFHIDNKGDENAKIYTYDLKTKKPTLFFGNDDRKAYIANSDKSGKTLFIVSNHEKKSVYSIYKIDVATKKLTRISDGKTNFNGALVSEDAKWVAASRYLSNNENQVLLLNVETKKTKILFKRKNSTFHTAFFSKDGRYLHGNSDYKRDRTGCAKIPLSQPNTVYYFKENKGKDTSCGYGEQSRLYYVIESFDGRSKVRLFKSAFKDEIKIPELYNNQSVGVAGYDRKTGKILLSLSAANNPGALHNLDVKTGRTSHVLDYNRSSIPVDKLASSYDVKYKSFDGMEIHGILFANPKWKDSNKKYPLIVWPHGGPDSHVSHYFHSWFQYLVLNGFVVFAPNYRGSTGYGKKFETLNDRDWGGAHIKDLVAGREAVEKLSYVDEKNAFIFGGSFGGYSTLAAVTFQPDAFKAAVGFIAIGNLFTFMKSIPPDEAWQTEFIREMGHPVKDKKLYTERSPFFHIDKIKVPLQIYQAENDVRTVKPEMDNFVAELRKRNKPVEYTVLKDVGHSMARPESRKQVLEGAVSFFKSKVE